MYFVLFQCDILHPLTTLYCKECDWTRRHNVLWNFTPDLDSWSLSYVPTLGFGLAVYNSQLVLIGGIESCSNEVCTKLWTSSDGFTWAEEVLPPMLAPRYAPTAVGFGSPERLLVVGGNSSSRYKSVEVYADGEWSVVESLPSHFKSWYSAVHNSNLYLSQIGRIIYCNLDAIRKRESNKPTGLWKELKRPCDYPILVSFKGQLLALSPCSDDGIVYAYSPLRQCWMHVGVSHLRGRDLSDCVAVSLPMDSFLILRMDCYPETRVFKISSEGEYKSCTV